MKELKHYILQNESRKVVSLFREELRKEKIMKQISREIANIDEKYLNFSINDLNFGISEANPIYKVAFFSEKEQRLLDRD